MRFRRFVQRNHHFPYVVGQRSLSISMIKNVLFGDESILHRDRADKAYPRHKMRGAKRFVLESESKYTVLISTPHAPVAHPPGNAVIFLSKGFSLIERRVSHFEFREVAKKRPGAPCLRKSADPNYEKYRKTHDHQANRLYSQYLKMALLDYHNRSPHFEKRNHSLEARDSVHEYLGRMRASCTLYVKAVRTPVCRRPLSTRG